MGANKRKKIPRTCEFTVMKCLSGYSKSFAVSCSVTSVQGVVSNDVKTNKQINIERNTPWYLLLNKSSPNVPVALILSKSS